MKVLLTLSRFEPNISPPLGIAYVAACLRKAGIEVEILDPTFENWGFSVERIKRTDYDVIGFSCFTMNYNISKKLAGIAKKSNKNIITVFGGPHPSTHPLETVNDKEVDIVCLGEGEQTFVELFKAIESKKPLKSVSGIVFKQGKKPIQTKPREIFCDLDKLPFPARDLLPMNKYLNAKLGRAAWAVRQPSTTIMVGRGCPYSCTYCTTKLILGKRLRFRSAKNVADEIELLIKDYSIRGLAFIDDTFTISSRIVEEICNEMIKRRIKIDWACQTRLDTISPYLLKKMRKAGCTYVVLGVESGNQHVLDNFVKKGIKLNTVEKAFKWAKQAGIKTGAYFMLGIPGETKENMRETIDFAKKLNPDVVNFNIARPMPKTEMYELAKKYGKINVKGWDDYNFDAKPIFESKDWSSDYVQQMYKQAYKEFYFRPSYMLKQLASIRSLADLKKIYHGFLMIGKRLSVKKEQ